MTKIFKIMVWRGNIFKTSNPKTVEKYRQRQARARLSKYGEQFPIKITEVHKSK